ncbi:hypothetical protein PENSPDRAFT_650291 [Peniophora sp. CONT]|nr:hypothetical protein PENSPDRAFT_650291 [Peniophora sp. CONT]
MSQNSIDEKGSISDKEPAHDVPTLKAEAVRDAPTLTKDQYGDKYVQSKGVNKIEALRAAAKTSPSGKRMLVVIGVCVWIAAFAYAIQGSTSYNYSVWATSSFQNHSTGLSALLVATSIIGSVCKPFLAKFSDIFGRTSTYFMGTLLYLMGFVIISQSPTLAAYIIGNVFATLGGTTVDFMNSVIVADLTDLQWRGFYTSLLSVPYLITPWFTADIVEHLGTTNNWRWGYGMYAIILPVSTLPVIGALMWLNFRAKKLGIHPAVEQAAAAEAGVETVSQAPTVPLGQRIKSVIDELDAFGLILLGFGWSLFLLPFSLESGAKGGWSNPSMIAMIVVGILCLIAYVFFERFASPLPSFPRRILRNKTFMMCIVIDFMYELAGYFEILYLSSYTYIVSSWSLEGWTYYSNTLTLSLCAFGVVAGAIQRYTHRYKALQVSGLCIKIIAYGLLISPSGKTATTSTGMLVASQVLTGMGGAFSVIGSQVAAQASVPHQDMTLVMALLSLWSSVGASIGSAIGSVMWAQWMPGNLREFLPASVNDTQVAEFYADITLIRAYDFNDPVRQGAIEAYRHTLWGFFVPALVLSFISLGAACFQTNYFLGGQHNAVMNVGPDGEPIESEQADRKIDTSAMSLPRKFVYYVFGA